MRRDPADRDAAVEDLATFLQAAHGALEGDLVARQLAVAVRLDQPDAEAASPASNARTTAPTSR